MLRSNERSSDPGRFAAVNGYVYIVLFFFGLIYGTVINKVGGGYPTPWSPSNQVQAFYMAGQNASVVGAISQCLAAVALFAFSAVLAAQLSRVSFSRVPALLVQASGYTSASFLLLSGLCSWLLSQSEILTNVPMLRAVQDVSFATGGVGTILPLTLFIGAPSMVALGAKWLPRWLGAFGILIVLAALLSVFGLANQAMTAFLPIARFGSFVWIAITNAFLMINKEAGHGQSN